MNTLDQWEAEANRAIKSCAFADEDLRASPEYVEIDQNRILALIAVIRKKDEALEHVSQFWRYDTDPIENDSDSNGAIAMNKAFRKCKDALAFTLDFEKDLG